MIDFKKKFTVLGAGKSGLAAAKRLLSLGAKVFVSDSSTVNLSALQSLDVEFEVGRHSQKTLECDYMIVSPGIPLTLPIIQKAKALQIKLLSEVELGFLLKPAKTKVIAVTGTNGKSTVVSLIKHILDAAGIKAGLAGNIGFPLTAYDLATENFDSLVLELSSFQLELLDTFKADIALLLKITPDHMNRYGSFSEYANVKLNIFRSQTKKDVAITTKENKISKLKISPVIIEDFLQDDKITVNGSVFVNDNPNLFGKHNLQNIAFAVLATVGIIDNKIIQKAINSFLPLKHRLEICAVKGGVTYVNDSKATTVDSTLCALQSFEQKVILILGGSDKGEDFSRLLPLLQNKTKKVFLIGETGKKMAKIFANSLECKYLQDIASCIDKCQQIVKNGDIVLLSPACASYDSFANFEERGDFFRLLVNTIE